MEVEKKISVIFKKIFPLLDTIQKILVKTGLDKSEYICEPYRVLREHYYQIIKDQSLPEAFLDGEENHRVYFDPNFGTDGYQGIERCGNSLMVDSFSQKKNIYDRVAGLETRVGSVSGPIAERLWTCFVLPLIKETINNEHFSKEKPSSFSIKDIDMVQELKDDRVLGWKEEYRSLRALDKNIYQKLNFHQKLNIFLGTFTIDSDQRIKGTVAYSDGSADTSESLSLNDNKQETIAFFGLLRQKISEKLAQRVQDFMLENHGIRGVAQVKFEFQNSDTVRIEIGFTPDALEEKADEFPADDRDGDSDDNCDGSILDVSCQPSEYPTLTPSLEPSPIPTPCPSDSDGETEMN